MASEFLAAHLWPSYIAGAVSLGLAVWLLVVDFRRASHRAFAFFMVLNAGASVWNAIGQVTTNPDIAVTAILLRLHYRHLASAAVVWFAVAYVVPPGRRRWLFSAICWAPIAAVELFMVFSPQVISFGARGDAGTIPFGVVSYFDFSLPLILTAGLSYVSLGLAAWLLARHHAKAVTARAKHSLQLIAFGLAALAIAGIVRLAAIFALVPEVIDNAWITPNLRWVSVSQVIGGLVGLGFATSALLRLQGEESGRRSALLLATFAGLLGGLAVLDYRGPLGALAEGTIALLFPLIITYAMVRHQLFGVDVKARWTVKASTLAGVFVAVGFAATEAATEFFGATTGSAYVGIAATALLVFAISPLQRMAERVARSAVPDAKPVMAMDANEKAAAYEEVVRMAWLDGNLSAAERRQLDAAKSRLQLSDGVAARVEKMALADLA